MHPQLAPLAAVISWSGHVRNDMVALLTAHDCHHTAGHCSRVAAEARRLARLYHADEAGAEIGGWLHDISTFIPNERRIEVAEALGIEILPEERTFPMIIHQKLSAYMARDLFGIQDESILSAIGCHTTLKPEASDLDKIVFVADKIKWDQRGDPPYYAAITQAVEQSLDQAAYCYLDFLWQRRATLRVLHPWAAQAHAEISGKLIPNNDE